MADSEKQYLVIDENGTGHLKVRNSPDGPLDHGLMGAAHAALLSPEGFRGNKYEGPGKEAAIAKLKKLYEQEKMDWPELRASEVSYDRIREMLNQALRKKYPPPENGPWPYVREVFQTYAIFENEGQLLRVTYSISDGVAELGEPEPVEASYVPASETVQCRSVLLDAMPAAGADGLVWIPIAVVGKWTRGSREFSITSDDLRQIVANFGNRKNGEVNVDYDHASEMPEIARGEPIPSAGRILKMRSNGMLYAGIDFTQRARNMIAAKEYRFVSPAIAYEAQDKITGKSQGTTLTSLALTNRPFLEELPPIKLSEISKPTAPASEAAPEGGSMPEVTIRAAAGGKLEAFRGSESLGTVELPASVLEATIEQESGKACSRLLTEIGMAGKSAKDVRERLATADRLERENTAREADRVFLSEAVNEEGIVSRKKLVAAVEQKNILLADYLRFEEADKKIEESVKSGKIAPAMRRFFLGSAIRDPEGFANFLATASPMVNFKPQGLGGAGDTNVTRRFLALIKERQKDGKVTYDQALSEIAREHPQLYAEYTEAVRSK